MAERFLPKNLPSAPSAAAIWTPGSIDRLAAFASDVRRVSPEFADVVDRMVARLHASGVGTEAPKPGEPMPDFLLPDETGAAAFADGLHRARDRWSSPSIADIGAPTAGSAPRRWRKPISR